MEVVDGSDRSCGNGWEALSHKGTRPRWGACVAGHGGVSATRVERPWVVHEDVKMGVREGAMVGGARRWSSGDGDLMGLLPCCGGCS